MNSADAWHDDNLEALLGLSVEVAQTMKEAAVEAAKERHPSGKGMGARVELPKPSGIVLTGADRCDDGRCNAGALYRVHLASKGFDLDWCRRHFFQYFPEQSTFGWKVTGANPDLFAELHQNDRLKGSDHA